jgi:hypothetical protein
LAPSLNATFQRSLVRIGANDQRPKANVQRRLCPILRYNIEPELQ